MASGRHSRARAVVFLIGGIAAGMVCLFFAIANAAWIPVRIPAWP